MMPDNTHGQWLEQQHLICLAATAVTAFYLHCLSIIMAGLPPPINWADHDIKVILLLFIAKKSEICDGGNFKKKTYVAAAEAIPSKARTWEQVKNKWNAVSSPFFHI